MDNSQSSSVPRTPAEYRQWWANNAPVPYPLCWCGCGETPQLASRSRASTGDVKGEPKRYVNGHSRRKSGIPYLVNPDTGCWVWQRTIVQATQDRYGQTSRNGKQVYAHRAYYEAEYGPIPVGWQVHHLCVHEGFGTTLCVRPNHLQALSVPVHSRTRRHSKLTLEDVREIKRLLAEGKLSQREIAERFRVHRNHVSGIKQGWWWKGDY